MINLNFYCDNIFDDEYFYNIKCLGKSTKSINAFNEENIFYFASHNNLYEVHEKAQANGLHGDVNCEIDVMEVDEFYVPLDQNTFMIKEDKNGNNICTNAISTTKFDAITAQQDDAYGKNGFYIFASVQNFNGHCFGGIVDIFDYQECTPAELMTKLNKYMEKTEISKADETIEK